MAIEKQSYLYEVLIRFDGEGYQGAHQIWMDRYVDMPAETIISEQQRAAEPLVETAISELVGAQSIIMARQIDMLKAELASHRTEMEALQEKLKVS